MAKRIHPKKQGRNQALEPFPHIRIERKGRPSRTVERCPCKVVQFNAKGIIIEGYGGYKSNRRLLPYKDRVSVDVVDGVCTWRGDKGPETTTIPKKVFAFRSSKQGDIAWFTIGDEDESCSGGE